ncbi:MAG: permease [Candidatus Methanogaster sp.]|uniref:Permease n=1 Tax=Candidatus Methanogaster sp. TaxID=3386292 RepID=A0AC61L271_9EURY|nr:MAG: permease [ANME-2 cluster archaeon]
MKVVRDTDDKGGNKGEGDKRKWDAHYDLYFLVLVIFLYLLLFFVDPKSAYNSLKVTGNIFIQIIPVLLFVLIFMALMDYFLHPKTVAKYFGKGSGIKGWFLAISTGILSHGPIYIWYPLLKDLRDQGMRSGLIAAFLYSRAIKIPLLPLMVYYFGLLFVVVLLPYVVIASLVEGKIIELIENRKDKLQ